MKKMAEIDADALTGSLHTMKQGYWIICVQSYEYDGVEIPKGRMGYHTSTRPVINKAWRRATEHEIENKKYHKANWYYITTT